jgi:ABC-type Fe3+ transport system substrate-binding protein
MVPSKQSPPGAAADPLRVPAPRAGAIGVGGADGRSLVLRALAATFLVLALSACAPGAPARGTQSASAPQPAAGAVARAAAQSGPLQDLIEGARREGQLVLIGGEGTFGGTEAIRRLADGYNRLYGLNVNVQFTPGPSMPQMTSRVAQEVLAGRSATTDVLIAYATSMIAAMQADALEAVDWSWAPNLQDPRLLGPNGVAVTYETSLAGITYNTQRLTGDLVPTSLQDLLKPGYKGRIATTEYAAYFDLLSFDDLWGKDRIFDYVTRLSDQVIGLIRCSETSRITSGEFDLLALDCSQKNAFQSKARGEPIAFVVPPDAALFLNLYMGIPRTAPHPNAAKLWANYLLSREAQDILFEYDSGDSHLVAGSKTLPLAENVEKAGMKLTPITIEFIQRHDEQEFLARRARIQEIVTRRN